MTVKIFYYYFSYFCISAVLAVLFVPMTRPLSFRLGAVDNGSGRRVHKGIIPRLGGVGMFMAFMMAAVFSLTRGVWDASHEKVAAILATSTIVFAMGVWDDIKGARVTNKLAAETLAAMIIYMLGVRITQISNPFNGAIILGWLSLPVTILWIVIITNAFNLIDGMDGLAAGTGIFIIATLFLLSANDLSLKLTFIIMAGSLVGFLWYNFPPASVFMGDSGSLFLGFFLGCISIVSSRKATAIATVMVPMIAFSLPLMDMLYAVLRRYYRGLPLGQADREHIHHKLLQKGLSKKKVLFVLYSINISLMFAVLLLVRKQHNMDFWGLLLLAVLAVAGLRMLGYIEFVRFGRELFRNYDIGRRRKYFQYVIRKFRHGAAKSTSDEDLKSYLTVLMKEYDFNSAEIRLAAADSGVPFYTFRNRPESPKPITLSFPICSGEDECIGDVKISRHMDEAPFLCTSEMVMALSEELSRFIANRRDGIPCSMEQCL